MMGVDDKNLKAEDVKYTRGQVMALLLTLLPSLSFVSALFLFQF